MRGIILLMHIGLGLSAFGLAGFVAVKAASKPEKLSLKSVKQMWSALGATIASGVVLAVVTKAALGRVCASFLLFIGVVSIVHYYQLRVRRRLGLAYSDQ